MTPEEDRQNVRESLDRAREIAEIKAEMRYDDRD